MLLPQKAVPKFKVPRASTVSAPSPSDTLPTFASNVAGALHWLDFGFHPIPTVPTAKRTVVSWDEWLKDLSARKINVHWATNPAHELGLIVGDELIVLDADSAESIAALAALEKVHDVTPSMVVK